MTKLLKDITEIITDFFAITIKTIVNADLGPIGTLFTAAGLLSAVIALVIAIFKKLSNN